MYSIVCEFSVLFNHNLESAHFWATIRVSTVNWWPTFHHDKHLCDI